MHAYIALHIYYTGFLHVNLQSTIVSTSMLSKYSQNILLLNPTMPRGAKVHNTPVT